MAKKASPRVRLVSAERLSEPSRPDLENKPQAELLPDKSPAEIQESSDHLTAEVKKFKITPYEEHLKNAEKKVQAQDQEEIASPPSSPVNVKRGEKISNATSEASEDLGSSEKNQELADLDARIARYEKMILTDRQTPALYVQRNKEDLEGFKAQRKELIEESKNPKASVQETPAPQEKESEFPILPRPERYNPDKPGPDRLFLAPEPAPKNTQESKTEKESPVLKAERAKAEAKALRVSMLKASLVELDKKIQEKKREDEVIPYWQMAVQWRSSKDLEKMFDERRRLEKEIKGQKSGFGSAFGSAAKKAFDKTKKAFNFHDDYSPYREPVLGLSDAPKLAKKITAEVEAKARAAEKLKLETNQPLEQDSTRKFWKQRLKGALRAGITEFSAAEQYRVGTKDIAQEVRSLSRLPYKTDNLSESEAYEEASNIKKKMKSEGIQDSSHPRFLELSALITERKIARNDEIIEDIIAVMIDQLETKLKNYKTDHGGDVLTPENKERIAAEMRANLRNLRTGKEEADVKALTDILRVNLDEQWKWRYVYGTLDAVLAGTVIYFVGSEVIALATKEAVAAKGGVLAAKEMGPAILEKTIWLAAKKRLMWYGYPDPTNAQIMKVSIAMAKENGVKVVAKTGEILWKATSNGLVKDIMMKAGITLKTNMADKLILAGL